MIGSFILLTVILVELVYSGIAIWKKKLFNKEKYVLNLLELFLALILMISNVIEWSFRWKLLFAVLVLRGIIAIIQLILKKPEKDYKISRVIIMCLGSVLVMTVVTLPAVIFPQHNQLKTSGNYEIDTKSYTWEDVSRVETFEMDGSNRKVTVQFWYPKTEGEEKFPLVVFSHGAFGYRYSNYSTYAELASNGYVVCSIDHTYHAFYTKQTDGKVITVNPEFMNSVSYVNKDGVSEDEIFKISRPWMDLRCGDMNFVIDTIEQKADGMSEDTIFSRIDSSKIGLIGHSMGGAASVTVGRLRTDIDTVIDLDGTMLGEELACENNRYIINEEPYPIPLLSINTTKNYEEGLSYGSQYVNNVILENAIDAREVHFNGAEHMNFTDLPLFSPVLASILGSGNIDSESCIKTMNAVILNYYNHYLKQSEELNIKESY